MYASEAHVPPERTGWRDPFISELHRRGVDGRPAGKRLPFNDLDFIWVEWNDVWPAAFAEYKLASANIDRNQPWYACLRNMGDTQHVSALLIVYNKNPTWLKLYALNDEARECFKKRYYREGVPLTANEYFDFLHWVRGWAEGRRVERESAPRGGIAEMIARFADAITRVSEMIAGVVSRMDAMEEREVMRGELWPEDVPEDEPEDSWQPPSTHGPKPTRYRVKERGHGI